MNNMEDNKDSPPDSAEYWSEQGAELLVQGKFEDAVKYFRKALELEPEDGLTWTGLGLALIQAGKYQEAVESFDRALEQSFFFTDTWAYRGEALAALGHYQEAVESYEKAIKCGVKDGETQRGRREALDRMGQVGALDPIEKYVREHAQPCFEAYKLLYFIEGRLHHFVCQRLKKAFGEDEKQWWDQGIPLPIRKKCAERREEDTRKEAAYNYTDLIDLREILGKNWKHFEAEFKRVTGKTTRKKDFLDGLVRLNEIRNMVMHPVRGSVTENDLQFARQMRDMIESFTSLE